MSLAMPLAGFDELHDRADRRPEPARIAVAGGDDPTVLEALQIAVARGWVSPIVVGPEDLIRTRAESLGLPLDGMEVLQAEADNAANVAVAVVRDGRARALMKGQIDTPSLMKAVL